MRESREELESMIEAILAKRFPEVELVDLEARGGSGGTLTLFIDRPGGVDLELCGAVSAALDDVRARYSLEVSSPGLDRRLRKPAHFAAALGREVAVKLTAPRDGRSNFCGVLVAADEDSVTLDLGDGSATLALPDIAKAHVVYNFDEDGGQRE
ncbi:MAG TPA: ribosome maturation factor RimP [Thermoleophilia bacterium]|nr:ribosome maturation factor RimP [Thermoleophilia bacterium]